ncbi:hypothetical protein fsci_08030 [Francisella sciaenopsi]|uniref:Uncharacterized protein n=1 Tax=Francisella sciaenopsi TaxID=3055034 RepID=A0ABQ6PEE7_9GAMM
MVVPLFRYIISAVNIIVDIADVTAWSSILAKIVSIILTCLYASNDWLAEMAPDAPWNEFLKKKKGIIPVRRKSSIDILPVDLPKNVYMA